MEAALVKFERGDLDQVRDGGLSLLVQTGKEQSKKCHTKMNIVCYGSRENEWEPLGDLGRVMPAVCVPCRPI